MRKPLLSAVSVTSLYDFSARLSIIQGTFPISAWLGQLTCSLQIGNVAASTNFGGNPVYQELGLLDSDQPCSPQQAREERFENKRKPCSLLRICSRIELQRSKSQSNSNYQAETWKRPFKTQRCAQVIPTSVARERISRILADAGQHLTANGAGSHIRSMLSPKIFAQNHCTTDSYVCPKSGSEHMKSCPAPRKCLICPLIGKVPLVQIYF